MKPIEWTCKTAMSRPLSSEAPINLALKNEIEELKNKFFIHGERQCLSNVQFRIIIVLVVHKGHF
jgi:hypothetical protein